MTDALLGSNLRAALARGSEVHFLSSKFIADGHSVTLWDDAARKWISAEGATVDEALSNLLAHPVPKPWEPKAVAPEPLDAPDDLTSQQIAVLASGGVVIEDPERFKKAALAKRRRKKARNDDGDDDNIG